MATYRAVGGPRREGIHLNRCMYVDTWWASSVVFLRNRGTEVYREANRPPRRSSYRTGVCTHCVICCVFAKQPYGDIQGGRRTTPRPVTYRTGVCTIYTWYALFVVILRDSRTGVYRAADRQPRRSSYRTGLCTHGVICCVFSRQPHGDIQGAIQDTAKVHTEKAYYVRTGAICCVYYPGTGKQKRRTVVVLRRTCRRPRVHGNIRVKNLNCSTALEFYTIVMRWSPDS